MRIAIFARNAGFIGPVLAAAEEAGHKVTVWKYTDLDSFDIVQIGRLLDNADVAFFDFCQKQLQYATNLQHVSCPIVARLHGLEVYSSEMQVIDWSRVHLVLSAAQELRFSRLKIRGRPITTHVMNIGTDIETFGRVIANHEPPGYDICIIAESATYRKGIYQTVEMMTDLLERSGRPWHLHVRSGNTYFKGEESTENLNFVNEYVRANNLETKVSLYREHMPIEDFCVFLGKMDILVSNSLQEGYHRAVADAMASGIYPLIHNWLGADRIWPIELIFKNQKQLVDKIIEWDSWDSKEKQHRRELYRAIAVSEHDEEITAEKIVKVLEEATK